MSPGCGLNLVLFELTPAHVTSDDLEKNLQIEYVCHILEFWIFMLVSFQLFWHQYTSQNLLRGNNEKALLKKGVFTIIYKRICIFMCLNTICLL